jgi:hypothetical protein
MMLMEQLEEILLLHELWLQSNAAQGCQAILPGKDLRQLDLRGKNLSYAVLTETQFDRADLSGATLQNANLRRASLEYANLANADLSNADLSETSATGADFSNALLLYAVLRNADFSHAVLQSADLSHAVADAANFAHCNMTHSILHETTMDNTDFTNANLYFASFSNTYLSGSILKETLSPVSKASLFPPNHQDDNDHDIINNEHLSGYIKILKSHTRIHSLLGLLRLVAQAGAVMALLATAFMAFLYIHAFMTGRPLMDFPFHPEYILLFVSFFSACFLVMLFSFLQANVTRTQMKISTKILRYKQITLPGQKGPYSKMEKN